MAKILYQRFMVQNRKADSDHADYLRVIGAGLPRTGTSSLKAALEILGFGPCHHMSELYDKTERCEQFIQAYDGHKVNFFELMKGYGSTVDTPTADFYKEIHRVYPQAKIVLTVRDSGEKWFESFENTVRQVFTDNFYYFSVYPVRFLRLPCETARKSWNMWTKRFGQIGPWIHDQHNARVISENNESEILVFNVKEGWSPLCKFLGVNIPQDIPFPNVNDSQPIKRRLRIARRIGWSFWAFISVMLLVLIYFINRFIM